MDALTSSRSTALVAPSRLLRKSHSSAAWERAGNDPSPSNSWTKYSPQLGVSGAWPLLPPRAAPRRPGSKKDVGSAFPEVGLALAPYFRSVGNWRRKRVEHPHISSPEGASRTMRLPPRKSGPPAPRRSSRTSVRRSTRVSVCPPSRRNTPAWTSSTARTNTSPTVRANKAIVSGTLSTVVVARQRRSAVLRPRRPHMGAPGRSAPTSPSRPDESSRPAAKGRTIISRKWFSNGTCNSGPSQSRTGSSSGHSLGSVPS